MKQFLFGLLAACTMATALAGTVQLNTPHLVALTPAVQVFRCSAFEATTNGYATVVTGFNADGTVQGQVQSHFSCGSSGRGGVYRVVAVCTNVTWDASGNVISTNTPTNGYTNLACPAVTLTMPSTTPPSSSVVGNQFANGEGDTAETVVSEICGSAACYETIYQPTLITP